MSAQHPPPRHGESSLPAIQIMEVPELWPPGEWISPPQQPPRGRETAPASAAWPADGSQGWPRQFAAALAETLAGARPVRQIQPWLSTRGSVHLHRVLPLFTGGQRPRLHRVLTACPGPDVIEMTMIVTVGPRTRALAIRLELTRAARRDAAAPAMRWVCTDIEAA